MLFHHSSRMFLNKRVILLGIALVSLAVILGKFQLASGSSVNAVSLRHMLLTLNVSFSEIIFLPVLGFLVGIAAAMLGIGGGVFIVPALQLLPLSIAFSPQLAAGTSLAMIFFKALSSTSGYGRQRRIDFRVGLLLALVTIPGALVGAYLTEFISEGLLIAIFALFLLYVASRMIFSPKINVSKSADKRKTGLMRRIIDSDNQLFEYWTDLRIGVPLGFVAGLSSGLLGIGGGSLMVPVLHFGLNFPMHIAVATSVFIMVFTTISGVATHIFLGNVALEYALLLVIGVIIGAQVGVLVAKRTPAHNLRRMFGFVLILVSIRVLFKLLSV